MKINIGCGKKKINNWINIDRSPQFEPEICVDVIKDQTFLKDIEFAYSEHFIEHITREEAVDLLTAIRKNLKRGGVVRLATVDLDFIIDKYLNDWDNQEWIPRYPDVKNKCDMINAYFYWWNHKYLYNQNNITEILLAAGFNKVVRTTINQSEHIELRNLETRRESNLIVEASIENRKLFQ